MADKDPLILDFVNGRVLEGADLDEYYVRGLDDESAYWDDIDLEDAFDLPPVLPPVRLLWAETDGVRRQAHAHGWPYQAVEGPHVQ